MTDVVYSSLNRWNGLNVRSLAKKKRHHVHKIGNWQCFHTFIFGGFNNPKGKGSTRLQIRWCGYSCFLPIAITFTSCCINRRLIIIRCLICAQIFQIDRWFSRFGGRKKSSFCLTVIQNHQCVYIFIYCINGHMWKSVCAKVCLNIWNLPFMQYIHTCICVYMHGCKNVFKNIESPIYAIVLNCQ